MSEDVFDRLESLMVDYLADMTKLKLERTRVETTVKDMETALENLDFGYVDKSTGEFVSRRKNA